MLLLWETVRSQIDDCIQEFLPAGSYLNSFLVFSVQHLNMFHVLPKAVTQASPCALQFSRAENALTCLRWSQRFTKQIVHMPDSLYFNQPCQIYLSNSVKINATVPSYIALDRDRRWYFIIGIPPIRVILFHICSLLCPSSKCRTK